MIVSTLLIQFYGWTGFDPIASLFIAILIAASVVPLVVDTGKVLCLDLDDRDVKIERALSEVLSKFHSFELALMLCPAFLRGGSRVLFPSAILAKGLLGRDRLNTHSASHVRVVCRPRWSAHGEKDGVCED